VPGPACYGAGGTAPTVTDANLVLGYLDPDRFLGGARTLDRAAAERAVDTVASALGLERVAAAAGIYRIINLRMAEGIRLMTVRRGVDPRRHALLSFGGAAGLHAVEVARELDVPRVIVPRTASVLSAWGMLATDLRYEVAETHVGDNAPLTDARLRRIFDELEARARAALGQWFSGPIVVQRSAEMRYGEQIFEVDVPLDTIDWNGATLLKDVFDRFHTRHEALYTYAMPGQEVVLVNARVAAIGKLPELADDLLPPETGAPPTLGSRRVYLGGEWYDVRLYDFEMLFPGQSVAGPAVIEAATTTVLLSDGDVARVTVHGWLDIALRAVK
jgi:N-methylhydantoinase A